MSHAKILANIRHPHVVNVYGTASSGATSIIVMEYLSGGSLKDRLANLRPWDEVLTTAREICDGLSFLHKNRIVHGNLRPANVLMCADGHAKLSDIGLDEHYVDSAGEENWYGVADEPKSVRSDIFSAGMIFSEMLTGATPTRNKGHLIQNSSFRSLPKELRQMIAVMLAPGPADRYQSFDEILPLIDSLLDQASKNRSASPVRKNSRGLLSTRFGLSRLSGAVGSFVRDALS